MATQTTNYGLKKPSYSDTADIGVINSNMDVIDAKMKEIDDKAGSGGGGTPVAVDSELSTTSENPVQNKVITQELSKKGTYSKPTSGIPKTDLSNEVQASLGKADTALQEHQDISGKAEKTEVTALFNSISDEWNASTTYAVGQYCIHNNILWKCLVANTNTEPTEGTYWTKVSVANEIASVNSSLETLTTPNTVKVYEDGGDYIELLICGKIVICQGVLSNKTGTITTFPEKYLPIVNIRFYVNGIDATLYTNGEFFSSKALSGFFNFTYLLA